MRQPVKVHFAYPTGAILVLAVVTGLAFGLRTHSAAAGQPICGNQVTQYQASVSPSPSSGAPADPFSGDLSNAPADFADDNVRAFLNPTAAPGGTFVGSGTLLANNTSVSIPSVVPSLAPGQYYLIICWNSHLPAGAPITYWQAGTVDHQFAITATPSPSASPSPTPTVHPTPPPTTTPTPTPTTTSTQLTPTPTLPAHPYEFETLWGNIDCSPSIAPSGALNVLGLLAGSDDSSPHAVIYAYPTPAACPALGSSFYLGNEPTIVWRIWGDVDCSGTIDAIDALDILDVAAGLHVAQTISGCEDFGALIDPIW